MAYPCNVSTDLQEFTAFADEFTVSDGFIFKGQRVAISRGARDDIMHRSHADHIGINGCV